MATELGLSRAAWRKASASVNAGGACVEIARISYGFAVRDSTDPGPTLVFGSESWSALLAGAKAGAFDRR